MEALVAFVLMGACWLVAEGIFALADWARWHRRRRHWIGPRKPVYGLQFVPAPVRKHECSHSPREVVYLTDGTEVAYLCRKDPGHQVKYNEAWLNLDDLDGDALAARRPLANGNDLYEANRNRKPPTPSEGGPTTAQAVRAAGCDPADVWHEKEPGGSWDW